MNKYLFLIINIFFFILLNNNINAETNFFAEAKSLFDEKKYEKSKFLFQRNIVFNPKDQLSYLYLAKIFKQEKNEKELEKNLKTTLLLDTKNEEALYLLIELQLDRSNFVEAKELSDKFLLICQKLCDNRIKIAEKMKNLE